MKRHFPKLQKLKDKLCSWYEFINEFSESAKKNFQQSPKLKKLYQNFPSELKYPKALNRQYYFIVMLEILVLFLENISVFFLQISKDLINKNVIFIALVLFTIYLLRDLVTKTINEQRNLKKNITRMHEDLFLKKTYSKFIFSCNGKITTKNKETGLSMIMPNTTIKETTNAFLTELQNVRMFKITNGFNIGISLVFLINFFVYTIRESKYPTVFIVLAMLITCITLFVAIISSYIKKRFFDNLKDSQNEMQNAEHQIMSISPISHEHANYMSQKLEVATKKVNKVSTKKYKDEISISFFSRIVHMITCLIFIGITFGNSTINVGLITDVLALVALFTQLISNVYSATRFYITFCDAVGRATTYEKDFKNLLAVYENEQAIQKLPTSTLVKYNIPPFFIEHKAVDGNRAFQIINETHFSLGPTDCVLLVGATGSGKSTTLRTLTQARSTETFKPIIETISPGRVKGIIHPSDIFLGNNSILSEITFDTTCDFAKLNYILERLHLLPEFQEKNHDVMALLTSTTTYNFSEGQKQRLAIARTLYNLTDEVQIVAFDEPTSNLNDEIALQVLQFIKEFCKDKLLIIATHQVNIGQEIANKQLIFLPSGVNTYTLTVKN